MTTRLEKMEDGLIDEDSEESEGDTERTPRRGSRRREKSFRDRSGRDDTDSKQIARVALAR